MLKVHVMVPSLDEKKKCVCVPKQLMGDQGEHTRMPGGSQSTVLPHHGVGLATSCLPIGHDTHIIAGVIQWEISGGGKCCVFYLLFILKPSQSKEVLTHLEVMSVEV